MGDIRKFAFFITLLLALLVGFQNCGKGMTKHGNGDPYEDPGPGGGGDHENPIDLTPINPEFPGPIRDNPPITGGFPQTPGAIVVITCTGSGRVQSTNLQLTNVGILFFMKMANNEMYSFNWPTASLLDLTILNKTIDSNTLMQSFQYSDLTQTAEVIFVVNSAIIAEKLTCVTRTSE